MFITHEPSSYMFELELEGAETSEESIQYIRLLNEDSIIFPLMGTSLN